MTPLASADPLTVALSAFVSDSTSRLHAIGASGEPEDQLRGPLENLFRSLADITNIGRQGLAMIGESHLADLRTRPDYAVQVRDALVGFIEVKAPGKGADPRRFRDKHDKAQWEKLRSLPNLVYTDGNEFSLWRDGELVGSIVRLSVDLTAGRATTATAPNLTGLAADFLGWQPIAPRTPKQLADMTARLCRLLRDEVEEQIGAGNAALTDVAAEWRTLLFPEATTAVFADGYAQAVTFGLLVARARGISLAAGIDAAAQQIGASHSVIGGALYILTTTTATQTNLRTSIQTMIRVLDVVDWNHISKGNADAWLYFYEEFLSVYDQKLRKLTGSYYTPPQVVNSMVGLVDEALRSRFRRESGLATPDVTVVDPAVGTGTFLLAVLRNIAATAKAEKGDGAIAGAVEAAMSRLVGFELQLGPFAVAQLRLLAELADWDAATDTELKVYVANTLANPFVEDDHLGLIYQPITESRRKANLVKKDLPVMVVIGNPPYKEKAKGKGAWVESGDPKKPETPAPFDAWLPPKQWGVSSHTKHLRNLYIYFWRWATWKVFDRHPEHNKGIVCYITVAGFINGPGFQKMRDYLRRTADEVWVIDCSPEGHQPPVQTRIFQGVQQTVCIVIASRHTERLSHTPAVVRHRALPAGTRGTKFDALKDVTLDGDGWTVCADGWRDPFLPASTDIWANHPSLDDLFVYSGTGVMPGRTWGIAPDQQTLKERWATLVGAKVEDKELLFHPHEGGDRTAFKTPTKALAGYDVSKSTIAAETDPASILPPVRYGFRTLDRQWIIPDYRLINRPNPGLWAAVSPAQVYLTALHRTSPKCGPAVSVTGSIPDLDHYNGRGGRVIPLWLDHAASTPNINPNLTAYLSSLYAAPVTASDIFAYIVGVTSHPAYTTRFTDNLSTPGLRIPLTADPALFREAAELGRQVIWLQTFGENFTDPTAGRPTRKPRLPANRAPMMPKEGAVSGRDGEMPDSLSYDPAQNRLHIGNGYIDNVTPAMWAYNTSGMNILAQWFSYRRANRERPIIGDRRPPSPLCDIQPNRWLPEYTDDLFDILHVIGLLVDLEQSQAALLEQVCKQPTVSVSELEAAKAFAQGDYPKAPFRATGSSAAAPTFDSLLDDSSGRKTIRKGIQPCLTALVSVTATRR